MNYSKKMHPNFNNRIKNWIIYRKIPVLLAFIIVGLCSTIWFLIRVIPKPSRASYPCMRIAAPLMSSFIIYATGLISSIFCLKKSKELFRKAKYVTAVMCALIGIIAGVLSFSGHNTSLYAKHALNSFAGPSFAAFSQPEERHNAIFTMHNYFPNAVPCFICTVGVIIGNNRHLYMEDQGVGIPRIPQFNWTEAMGGMTYHIQVPTSKTFAAPVIDQSGIADVSYNSPIALGENTIHYWRVRASEGPGKWSDTSTFTTSEDVLSSKVKYAGARSSWYGNPFTEFPPPEDWGNIMHNMAANFPGSEPVAIWIVGTISSSTCELEFPFNDTYTYINYVDKGTDHEAYLTYFDTHGIKVYLQVESGMANIDDLIDIVMGTFSHHECVAGFGIDVEWYQSTGEINTTIPVTDILAGQWENKLRDDYPGKNYRLFLKHWMPSVMPPNYRGDIVFVNDSQIFPNLQTMVDEFEVWANLYENNIVMYQVGYESDYAWWQHLTNPPKDIGDAIDAQITNPGQEIGFMWVDFTLNYAEVSYLLDPLSPVPILAQPQIGAVDVTLIPTYQWTPSTGAVAYDIQVSTAQDFSALVIDASGIASTSYTSIPLQENTTHYWRVRDNDGPGDWSAVFSFTTGEQVLPEFVLQDNFLNEYGDSSNQSYLGAAYGYSKYGAGNVHQGGGLWHVFRDTYGSYITTNGTTLNDGNFNDAVSNGVIKIKFHMEEINEEEEQYPYAGIECPFIGGLNDNNYYDLTSLDDITIRARGTGTVKIALVTEDINSLSEEDSWGFYGYYLAINSSWQTYTIPVDSLEPDPWSWAKNQGWNWNHGRSAVSRIQIEVNDNDLNDAEIFIDSIYFNGITYSDFNFVYSAPNANQAPIDIAIDNLSVPENSDGAIIGNVTVTDPNTGDTHSFGIDDTRFEIVNDQLKLKDGDSLDYAIEPTVSIEITATDNGGLSYSETFIITVIDVPIIVKGPYLQKFTQDSMVIMWETDIASGGRVDYGLAAPGEGSVENTDPVTIHEMQLTGLDPDTTYYYAVTSGGITSDTNTFSTAPETERPFRFVAYGDNLTNTSVHAQVIGGIISSVPEFVINSGDMVYNGEVYAEWGPQFFDPAYDLMVNTPLLPILGNHEYWGSGDTLWFKHFFSLPNNEEWFAFSYSNARFIGLNTNAGEGVDYSTGSDQYNWLLNEFDSPEYTNATWHFVYFHHPPYTSTNNHSDDDSVKKYLVPLFEENDVDMVFNGHSHAYERYHHNGIYYIVTGGGGADLATLKEDTEEPIRDSGLSVYHFCILDVYKDSCIFTVKDPDNAQTYDSLFLRPKNHAPKITTTAPTTAMEDIEYIYNADATDHENHNLTWSLSNEPGDMEVDPTTGIVTWTPAEGALSSGEVTLTVTDDGVPLKSDTELFTITVTPVNDAPEFTSTAVTTATEDAPYSYYVTTTDEDIGATLAISSTTLPSWLTLTDNLDGTASLTGTPINEHVGDNDVILTVSDGIAPPVEQAFVIKVANTNDAPEFTSTPVTTATEDAPYSYYMTTTDEDIGATLTISSTTLPSWLTLIDNLDGTASLTGTPLNEHVGDTNVVLTVSDGIAPPVGQAFTVTVTPVNDTPEITSTASTTATEDVQYIYNPAATDEENDNLTWSLLNEPQGMPIDPVTGAIKWTPGEGVLSSGEVTLTVTDGGIPNRSDSEKFTLTVTPVNDAPSDIALNNVKVKEKTPGAVVGNITVTDPDFGDSHTFDINDKRFEIIGDELKLKDDTALYYAIEQQVLISITATDAGGLSYNEDFTIAVDPTSSNEDIPDITSNYTMSFTAVPNPVNKNREKSINLIITAPEKVNCILKIFDPAGNIIFEKSGEYPSGNTIIEKWNLRNKSGRVVAGGIYLAVLRVTSNKHGSTQVLKTAIGIGDK